LVGAGAEVAAGGLDGVAIEKEFAAFHLADLGIERDQPAALDENAFHECPPVAGNTTGAGRSGPDILLAAQGLAFGIGRDGPMLGRVVMICWADLTFTMSAIPPTAAKK